MNFGIIYILLRISIFSHDKGMQFKIGLTRAGVRKRVGYIRKSTGGWIFPVFFAPVLFLDHVERFLHRRYQAHRSPLERGNGRTEYFSAGFFGATVVFAIADLLGIWLLWALLGFGLFQIWQ